MADIRIRRIIELTENESDQIVGVLVRAYHGNVVVDAMTGGKEHLQHPLFRAMIRAGALAGHLYVVERDHEEILSITLWFSPGTKLFGTEEQRKLGFEELLSKLDDETIAWWKDTYPAMMAKFLKRWLPKSFVDCWYLNVIGTDPKHQRKGYASRLLEHAVQNVVASPNLIAFCSVGQDHANFYSKAGFPIRDQAELYARTTTFQAFGHSRII